MAEFRLNVIYDECGECPRHDCDCYLGILACWHRRYSLSDENAVDMLLDEIRKTRPDFQYDEPDELRQACEEIGMVVVPVYGYDHGGLAVSTSPFSCPWDSGQLGFIAAPKPRIREMLGVRRITNKIMERVDKNLKVEVESCWGFVGSDVDANGMIDNICVDGAKDSLLIVNESGCPEDYYYDFKSEKAA